jgi:hypothetical protein
MLTVDDTGKVWRFPLSAISHYQWGDDSLKIFLMTSSGERKLEFRYFKGGNPVLTGQRTTWMELAGRIASGREPLTYPYELSDGRIEAGVK